MTTDLASAPPEFDAELDARLQRLAARRRPEEKPDGKVVVTGAVRARRRHPARGARIAALALSLATTGGLSLGFSAIDGPSSSVLTAQGGVVAFEPASVAASSVPASVTVVNGDVYANKWGPVQVQATFGADGSLAAVDALQAPSADGKSVRINNRAVPALNSEALAAQSAQVDTISGATYTSVDYERSLQSAIDAARAAGITQLA
jgi:uncharacterized protein with FMN-binding domain